jgi:NarL family two-component system response regulator LiaR
MRNEIRILIANLAEDIHECSDGIEAIAACARQQPDWVLMDIVMQGLDGLEATKRIKTAWPDAKVVIVTSYDDAELKEAAREVGASGYVLKENLFDVLRILGDVEEQS